MMTFVTSPLSNCARKSLKITSSSVGWVGTLNRLNSSTMKTATTSQNKIFLIREFIPPPQDRSSACAARQTRRDTNIAASQLTRKSPADFNALSEPLAGIVDGVQHGEIRKVAILLLVVEAIADDVLVRDFEPDVIDVHVHFPPRRLAQQRADANGLGLPLRERFDEILDRQAG